MYSFLWILYMSVYVTFYVTGHIYGIKSKGICQDVHFWSQYNLCVDFTRQSSSVTHFSLSGVYSLVQPFSWWVLFNQPEFWLPKQTHSPHRTFRPPWLSPLTRFDFLLWPQITKDAWLFNPLFIWPLRPKNVISWTQMYEVSQTLPLASWRCNSYASSHLVAQ